MKRLILVVCSVFVFLQAHAQGRKQLANFSHYKQFFNPSLTGYEGSVLKSLYRNQWTGFEDAPKTILASAELDMAMLSQKKGRYFSGRSRREAVSDQSAKHALGLTLLHDQFGPAKEMQVNLSYGAAIRLSEDFSLRWGTALTYTAQHLDGNSLTLDQENDPRFSKIIGQENRSGRGDINLGLSLTSARFYLGYALQNVTDGKLLSTGSDYLSDFSRRKHVASAGYRMGVTDDIGFTVNGLYQYDQEFKSTVEGQVKAVYNNLFWVSGGYRNDLAYTLGAGLHLDQLSVG